MTESRKATDVLLSLEFKVDQLISLYRSQDLVLKVLANKLNGLIDTVNSLTVEETPVSIVEKPKVIVSNAESVIAVENNPVGFRRTSRPETYENSPSLPRPINSPSVAKPVETQFTDFSPPPAPPAPKKPEEIPKIKLAPASETFKAQPGARIPVEQRIVDNLGKAVFLANVQILDSNGEEKYKTRTNGVGKWQASLETGNYKVKISKSEAISKDKIDLVQNITVDGLSTTQVLPILICQ